MKRQLVVAFALMASLLVATAMPVAASDSGGVVVSTHTTDTDFNDATLTNMTVVGSGTSATVEIDVTTAQTDGFEDGDTNGWTVETGTSFTAQSSVAKEGTYSGDFVAPGSYEGFVRFGATGNVPSTGNVTIESWVRGVGTSSSTHDVPMIKLQESGTREAYQVEVVYRADTGPKVQLYYRDHAAASSSLLDESGTLSSISDGEWIRLTLERDQDTGEMTAKAYDDTNSLLVTLTGTDTQAVPDEAGVGGYRDHPDFDGWALTDEGKNLPAEYVNTHSATSTVGGFANISTASDVSVTATWRGDSNGDGSYDTLLNQTSGITSAANHSFTWSEFSGDDVQVNLTVESAGSDEMFVLEAEGVEAVGDAPTVDNASASPTGELTTATPTLSIDVNDSDFPDVQGDSVDVEFFVDGNSQGTDTLTTNGTASFEVGSLSGGDHTWHVVANDTYGHSVTSQTFDITTPSNITIRNESDPYGIIDSVTVEAIIAGTGQTVDVQNTTNGNISLAGLPTEEEYIFVLEADGFHTRTVIVEDVFEQDDVFMLSTSLTSIENTFVLDDQTGQFEGDNVTLIIQRPINRSVYDTNEPEEFQWTDIAGDRTGAAEEFTVDLEKEKRFRIIVDNNEGDRRVLGEYQAETAGSVTLNIGELTFDIGADGATYEYDASFTSSNVKFNYTDPDDTTSSLTVKIFESGNASNEIYNQTHTDLGTLSVTQALSGDEANETWVVEFSGTRDGESIAGSVVVGASDLSPGVPLDDAWKTRIAFSLLLVLTGLTAGGINAETGTVVAALAGGVLWWSGWLPAEIGGGVVALALFVAAALTLSTRGGEEIQ